MADIAVLRDRALALLDEAEKVQESQEAEDALTKAVAVLGIDALATALGSLDRIADALEMIAASH